MEKAQIQEEMEKILPEVNAILKKINLRELVIPVDDKRKMTEAIMKEGLVWLYQIKILCFDYTKIRRLLPEKIWQRYADSGSDSQYRECKLLNLCKKRIRNMMMTNKHIFFKKERLKREKQKAKNNTDK